MILYKLAWFTVKTLAFVKITPKKLVFISHNMSRVSPVGIATGYGLRQSGDRNPLRARFSYQFRQSVEPNEWVPDFFPGDKATGELLWQPTPTSAEVKKKQYSYTSTPSLGLMIRPRVNFTFTFTFHVTQNTVLLNYKNQPVTAAQDSKQCFLYVVRNVTNPLLHCVRECKVTSDGSLYTDTKGLQIVMWTGIS